MRYIHSLEDGFARLRETLGLNSNDEVVTAVRKTEEQTSSLRVHMSEVVAEIDSLEMMVREVKQSIGQRQRGKESAEGSHAALLSNLRNRVRSLSAQLSAAQSTYTELHSAVSAVFPAVQEACALFATPEFQPLSLAPFPKSPFVTSETLLSHLAEVDTGIASLHCWLQYVKTGKSQPGSAVIPKKRFGATSPMVRTLALQDEIVEESKSPLQEEEFRARARLATDRRLLQTAAGRKELASKFE